MSQLFSNMFNIIIGIADIVVEVVKGGEDINREVSDDEVEVLGSTSTVEVNKRIIGIQVDALLSSSTKVIRNKSERNKDDNINDDHDEGDDAPTIVLKVQSIPIIPTDLQTITNELRRLVDDQKIKKWTFENKLNYIEETIDSTRRLQVVYNQEAIDHHINFNLIGLEEMIANSEDGISFLVRIIRKMEVQIDELGN